VSLEVRLDEFGEGQLARRPRAVEARLDLVAVMIERGGLRVEDAAGLTIAVVVVVAELTFPDGRRRTWPRRSAGI
jgi:hypothetical protein